MKKIVMAALAMGIAVTAAAEGYQVNTLSTKQLGMGHTGVALKLGAESMLFNPAGMAFSDRTLDISASVSAVAPSSTATLPDGSEWDTHAPISTPLNVAASFRIFDNMQGGVAFYTPYGSGIEWLDNWPGAVLNQRCTLRAFTIQPTLSWRPLPGLSIGAGLMMTWGNVNLDKGLVSAESMDAMLGVLDATGMGASMGIPAGYRYGHTTPASVNLNGTAKPAFGVNVGVMYDITGQLTAGVSFRSKMDLTVDAGTATVRYADDLAAAVLQPSLGIINQANFEATMPAPYVLSFGLGYKPTDRWTVSRRQAYALRPAHCQELPQRVGREGRRTVRRHEAPRRARRPHGGHYSRARRQLQPRDARHHQNRACHRPLVPPREGSEHRFRADVCGRTERQQPQLHLHRPAGRLAARTGSARHAHLHRRLQHPRLDSLPRPQLRLLSSPEPVIEHKYIRTQNTYICCFVSLCFLFLHETSLSRRKTVSFWRHVRHLLLILWL